MIFWADRIQRGRKNDAPKMTMITHGIANCLVEGCDHVRAAAKMEEEAAACGRRQHVTMNACTAARSHSYARGGGCPHLWLASIIRPLTTHPFRDGAPFLILIETPPAFGRSLHCFHVSHSFFFANFIPLLVSPPVATIYLLGQQLFSRCCLVCQTPPCLIRPFPSSPLLTHTSRSSSYISDSPTM